MKQLEQRKNIEERKVYESGMRRSKMPLKTNEQLTKNTYKTLVKKILKHTK